MKSVIWCTRLVIIHVCMNTMGYHDDRKVKAFESSSANDPTPFLSIGSTFRYILLADNYILVTITNLY